MLGKQGGKGSRIRCREGRERIGVSREKQLQFYGWQSTEPNTHRALHIVDPFFVSLLHSSYLHFLTLFYLSSTSFIFLDYLHFFKSTSSSIFSLFLLPSTSYILHFILSSSSLHISSSTKYPFSQYILEYLKNVKGKEWRQGRGERRGHTAHQSKGGKEGDEPHATTPRI